MGDSKLHLFLSVLVFGLTSMGFCCEDNANVRNITFLPPVYNRSLTDHVIASQTVDNLEQCQMVCFLHPKCSSIDFNSETGNCRLSTQVNERHLQQKPGYIYQGSKDFCHEGACDASTRICQSGYGSRGYRCICSLCFTGLNCTQYTYKMILNFPRPSTDQHVVLKEALVKEKDNITEFTISVWIQMVKMANRVPTVFTFENDQNSDELAMYFRRNELLYVDIKNNPGSSDRTTYWNNLQDLFSGSWHHIVLTWNNAAQKLKLYINGTQLDNNATFANLGPLEKKVRFALGQEQDNYSTGGYDIHQSFVGNITGFNMWKREATLQEIKNLSSECPTRQEGDLIKWRDLVVHRSSSVEYFCRSSCRGV